MLGRRGGMQLKTRKMEHELHESKVRLTNEDLKNESLAEVNKEIGKENWGLAIRMFGGNWENTKVVANECGFRQGKVKDVIDSLRKIHCQTKVLHSFESLIMETYFW